jgi:hypothetical protein
LLSDAIHCNCLLLDMLSLDHSSLPDITTSVEFSTIVYWNLQSLFGMKSSLIVRIRKVGGTLAWNNTRGNTVGTHLLKKCGSRTKRRHGWRVARRAIFPPCAIMDIEYLKHGICR